jgi:hypothetical protein
MMARRPRAWVALGAALCVLAPARASSCTFWDEIAVASAAASLLSCLDMSADDLDPLIDEITALTTLPAFGMKDEVNGCLALPCPDGEDACAARVACLNTALVDLNAYLEEHDVALSAELVNVVGKFCGCYTILENIPMECYDYVDATVGFHLPIDLILANGAAFCSQVDAGCAYVQGFVDNCLSADDASAAQLAGLCAAYADALVPGALADRSDDLYAVGDDAAAQQAYLLCAAEAASVTLLPAGAVSVLEAACSADAVTVASWAQLASLRAACAGAFDGVVGVVWPSQAPVPSPTPGPNATPAPTPLPSAEGAVTVAIALSFASDAPYSQDAAAALKTAVAATTGVAESSVRGFAATVTTTDGSAAATETSVAAAAAAKTAAAAPPRQALLRTGARRAAGDVTSDAAYAWAVTLAVVAVPASVGASDGPTLAALLAADLGSATFAAAASDALRAAVTLDPSDVDAQVTRAAAPNALGTLLPLALVF